MAQVSPAPDADAPTEPEPSLKEAGSAEPAPAQPAEAPPAAQQAPAEEKPPTAESAPAQERMAPLSLSFEESICLISTEHATEHFMRDHLSISKFCNMMCFPCCCLSAPFVSKHGKMEYHKVCQGPCSCPMTVSFDGDSTGTVRAAGCCDNGFAFGCCPCFFCGGQVKIMGMKVRGAEDDKIVLLKSLFPCWCCVETCAVTCVPLAVCLNMTDACCNYCKGSEFKSITQPVYKGPWSRATAAETPVKLGELVMTQRYNPVGPCCAIGKPMRYFYKPTTDEGENLSREDLASLSLALQAYRGLHPMGSCCDCPGFQIPTGVSCLDMGLDTKAEWSTVQEVMKSSA